MISNFANFAYSTVLVGPNTPVAGTTLSVQVGHGSRFPAAPFLAIVWPNGSDPTPDNAEIILVGARTGDAFSSITRAREGTTARTIGVGDRIQMGITKAIMEELYAGTTALVTNTHVYLPIPAGGYLKVAGAKVASLP